MYSLEKEREHETLQATTEIWRQVVNTNTAYKTSEKPLLNHHMI